jgi:hypothetical protein
LDFVLRKLLLAARVQRRLRGDVLVAGDLGHFAAEVHVLGRFVLLFKLLVAHII